MANPKTIGPKLGPEKQVEMSFDDEPIWHRGVRERGRAYRAFAVYRDLGPRRSLIAAYRIVRRGVAANGSVDPEKWTGHRRMRQAKGRRGSTSREDRKPPEVARFFMLFHAWFLQYAPGVNDSVKHWKLRRATDFHHE